MGPVVAGQVKDSAPDSDYHSVQLVRVHSNDNYELPLHAPTLDLHGPRFVTAASICIRQANNLLRPMRGKPPPTSTLGRPFSTTDCKE